MTTAAKFLRDELAPTPGRFNAMVRLVVATSIVLVTSMTLQVPSVALSLFIVFNFTVFTPGPASRNSVAGTIGGIAAIVTLTLSLAITLVVFRLTVDREPLRVAAMALVFFLGMFALRVFAAPPLAFIFGLVVIVTQAVVDLVAGPEDFVRGLLWVWMVIAYPAVVATAVNLLLLPAYPEPLLRREYAARLRACATVMAAPGGGIEAGGSGEALAAFAQEGAAPLMKLLHLAQVRDSSLAPLRAERMAKAALVQRLVESAAALADLGVAPSAGERRRLAAVAAQCERLADAAEAGTPPPAVPVDATHAHEPPTALEPLVAGLERIVRDLAVAERAPADDPRASPRLFVPDALTNPRYAQFALKATLAAMGCYVAYTALDWDGIHTCMITCAIVALGSTGAMIQKGTLRLAGAAIAGALALASIVFVVPHMTSIAQLLLLVAAVTAPAAWVAMGGERTSYVGVQMAFTFYLVVLQGFGPSTDVTEFRDRFVGIAFGVVVMSLVFANLWPESAASEMVRSLVAALRRMADMARGAGDADAARAAAWRSLGAAQRMAELSAFEPSPPVPAGLVDRARHVLLAQSALGAGSAGPLQLEQRAHVADAIEAVAQRLETGTRVQRPPLRDDLADPLAALLAERVNTLQRAASIA